MAEASLATVASMRDDKDPVIIMSNVNKWYGEFHVLRDINLQVDNGERIVICGPSGSGKSTLIRCLNRLEEHQQGDIIIDGVALTSDVRNIDKIRTEVGMVFQSFNLFPHLTVLDNLCIAPQWVRKVPRADAERVAMEYLERVKIPDQALKYPGQLSGGQQQRVAIARALATAPDLVFADEPTGNLDSRAGREVLTLLRTASREHGQSIAMVTHDPVAASHADRVLFLGDGHIIADKPRQSAEQISAFMLAAEVAA